MRCCFCNKKLEIDSDCWHIDECGDEYCYQDFDTFEEFKNTCLAKDLLRCGHNIYRNYIDIKENGLDSEENELNIFYTTVVD